MLSGVPLTPCRAAVLGSPIEHSLSPILHRTAYAELGLAQWSYEKFAVGGEGESSLLKFLAGRDSQWLGFSVTMPLKEDALAISVAASGHAREMGAANTLVRTDRGWIADSTDAYGALEALLEAGVGQGGRSPRRAVLLGAGATARSVIDALGRLGVREIVFVVRTTVRPETEQLATRRGIAVAHEAGLARGHLDRLIASADVTVSTLPTGTDLGLDPVPAGTLAGRVLMDVVYGGWPTPLARWAADAGATTISGLGMLVHQAGEQVRLMTGLPAPVAAMRAAVLAHLDSGS
ncbi:shikimate dehydrogenase [Kineosphaera limosa NBRC 100340]|uniref:Shikimate dehydrogenase n=1 Tax=Kineosphaera limosa NBRC 100340 TaxID=1184609 RepID=K6WRC2_9MICO|nr:shikimate dehydrogenase [Kineosphaera limosa NBRC 100340]